MTNLSKKDRLINSAAILFHHVGPSVTSLADIAKHADIPIGNVYYYFKTKDDLALAAIEKRREQFIAAYALLDEGISDPRQRLIEAIRYFDRVRDEYTRYGCPIGKMIDDGDAEKNPVTQAAAEVLDDFVKWAKQQFEQLGHDADVQQRNAISLSAGIQGAAMMAKSTRNPQVITDEVQRLIGWLESLPNRKIQLGKVGMRPAASNDVYSAA